MIWRERERERGGPEGFIRNIEVPNDNNRESSMPKEKEKEKDNHII